MAVSADPLERASIRVASQDTGDRLSAPSTNSALQLAEALGDLQPAARALGASLGEDLQQKAEAHARRDATVASGARLADAVRQGIIHPTQNPWYTQAYRRESAALRTQSALRALQLQAVSWDTQGDPTRFEAQWREGVRGIAQAEGTDADTEAGFVAAERQITPQVLQSNQSQNASRIVSERLQNVSALAAEALADAARQYGGTLSPNRAYQALDGARARWFATGGSLNDWNNIAKAAITSAAYSTQNSSLLDLARAPEIINGPSEAGGAPLPFEARPQATPGSVVPVPIPASSAAQPEPLPATPAGSVAGRSYLPAMGPVTGSFGERRSRRDGTPRRHGGIDLSMPVGTPLRTPEAVGRVGRVGRSGGFGLRAEINFGGGVSIVLGHLSHTDLRPGQLVPPGVVVAMSGGRRGDPNAGNATGPHLHYEVRRNGVAVDPRTVHFASISSEVPPTESAQAPVDTPTLAPSPPVQGQAAGTIADIVSRGPSLYDIAGNAEDFETARYRIDAANHSRASDALQQITAERRLAGIRLADRVWATYGDRLLTGNFSTNAIVAQLTAAGERPEIIAAALSQIREATTDSASLMGAQIEANGRNPEQARQNLRLATRARRDGYSDSLADEVGREVVAGHISGPEAQSMITGALDTTNRNEAEARTDTRQAGAEQREEDRAERGQRRVLQYAALQDYAHAKAHRLVGAINQSHLVPSRQRLETEALVEGTLRLAMVNYLNAHPGDFEGAERASNLAGIQLMERYQTRAAGRTPPPSTSAANPRR